MTDPPSDADRSPALALSDDERWRLEDLLRAQFFTVETVRRMTRHDHGCDALVDVSFTVHRGTSEHRRMRSARQTVAYFDRPESSHPPFAVQPREGIAGALLRRFFRATGMPTLELVGSDDFNRRFSILTFHPDSTRRLFDRALVDSLLRHPEFTVKAGGGGIAITHGRRTIPEAEAPALFESARDVADRIVESAASLPADQSPSGSEAVASIENLGGIVGRQLRGRLVTHRQVHEFMSQTPPRTAPTSIRRLVYGPTRFFMVFGAFFVAVGGAIAAALFLVEDDSIPAAVPYLVLLAPLFGLLVFMVAFRSWWRRFRLLRRGRSESAKALRIEPTESYVNGERQFDVTFRTAGGPVMVRLGSGPAQRARELEKTGGEAWLLVDPAARTKPVWPGGWAVDSWD